jgi:serine/threonine protein kinase
MTTHAFVTTNSDGGQLNNLLHKKKVKYSLVKKFSMMTDLANGLSYLHGQRIIHRDLGSRNVLIKGARVKICDFGCARR